MVEENVEIQRSETRQSGLSLLPFCHSLTFTMVEEKLEIQLSETPQNGLILLLFCHSYIFTMVEENVEIWLSGTKNWPQKFQNSGFRFPIIFGQSITSKNFMHTTVASKNN